MILYGIRNCDTVKKARAWLEARGVAYDFHDYKTAGIDEARLAPGRPSSAGRSCSTAPAPPSASCPRPTRQGLDEDKAVALMLAQPSMIKRPVLDLGDRRLLGFGEAGMGRGAGLSRANRRAGSR